MNKEIIQWACKYLTSHSYTLKNKLPENVQNTPWSYVLRFATTDGYIYLKRTPKMLALEAPVIQILTNQFHVSVPKVIASNTELNCFLMKDAGRKLREVLKKKFDAALYCKAIDKFTALQLAVADHVDVFLNIGVPDWRLNKLPDLYKQLISQKNILIEDGLSESEISELERLQSNASNLCKKLSTYPITESIVQPDFHDNNLLINDVTEEITIIDLGEIVISHPFFSLINCLAQSKTHHGLKEGDDAYQDLMNACFKNYMTSFEHNRNLLEALAIARILWFIYGALAHYRLVIACDKTKLMAFQRQGRLIGDLKEFRAACLAIDSGLLV